MSPVPHGVPNLEAIRKRRGITLRQIAAKTRIRDVRIVRLVASANGRYVLRSRNRAMNPVSNRPATNSSSFKILAKRRIFRGVFTVDPIVLFVLRRSVSCFRELI